VFSGRFRQLLHSHGHAAKEKSVPNLLRNGEALSIYKRGAYAPSIRKPERHFVIRTTRTKTTAC
jgi:hypothetical protein